MAWLLKWIGLLVTIAFRAILGAAGRGGGGGGGGGFPTVLTSATTGIDSGTTSHVYNLPAGITAGDLLLVAARMGSSSAAFTAPAGWNAAMSATWFMVIWRIADGSEGSTVTMTSNNSRRSCAVAARISPVGDGPEAVTNASSLSSGEVVAPWGSAANLFVAVTSNSNETEYLPPSNYGNIIQASMSVQESAVAMAFRELEADRDTPGLWTAVSGAVSPHSGTLVVGPS